MPHLYILECADGTYYTGSTQDLPLRLEQHRCGHGANYTRKRLPVELAYSREYKRIDDAFLREKQIQGWSHAKKKALIEGNLEILPDLSRNYRQHGVRGRRSLRPSTGSGTEVTEETPSV